MSDTVPLDPSRTPFSDAPRLVYSFSLSPDFHGRTPRALGEDVQRAEQIISRALFLVFVRVHARVRRRSSKRRVPLSGNGFPASSVYFRAKPKSIRYNRFIPSLPLPMHTFPGLMSLCTYPASCTLSNASNIATAIALVVLAPNRPPLRRPRRSAKFSPTNSIAKNGFPS